MEFEGLLENKEDCITRTGTISCMLFLTRARDIFRWCVWDFDPEGSLTVV